MSFGMRAQKSRTFSPRVRVEADRRISRATHRPVLVLRSAVLETAYPTTKSASSPVRDALSLIRWRSRRPALPRSNCSGYSSTIASSPYTDLHIPTFGPHRLSQTAHHDVNATHLSPPPLPSSGITIRHLAQLDVPEATFSPYAPAHTPFCVFDTPTITLRSASRTRCALPPPVDSSRRANATGRLDAPLSATYTRTSSATTSDIAGIAVRRASLTRCAFCPPEESANSPPRM
ncbi:hypothetical protein B0H10DRAFT_677135 [Mycena sp. CBHHK59/15]|nr:hypothetical protein B0H10DRAFT_677135 [Mycena sp. CBHHK59/15]